MTPSPAAGAGPEPVPFSWTGAGPSAHSPAPDSAVGAGWAVRRFVDSPLLLPEGCPPEVAVLETDGPVYLTAAAARHLAGLLLAYAEGGSNDGPGSS